jgi:hypothetical protein
MCTVLLPPGGYPIAVKYIVSIYAMNVEEEKEVIGTQVTHMHFKLPTTIGRENPQQYLVIHHSLSLL